MVIKKDGYTFKKSSRKHKKYDVYKDDKYITSFGDNRYQQYHDKIGLYKSKDHKDDKRRQAYRARHQNDKLSDPTSAGYFAMKYLW